MKIKYANSYFSIRKRFIGLGFIMSYKDTPTWLKEQIGIEIRLFFIYTWIYFDLD